MIDLKQFDDALKEDFLVKVSEYLDKGGNKQVTVTLRSKNFFAAFFDHQGIGRQKFEATVRLLANAPKLLKEVQSGR